MPSRDTVSSAFHVSPARPQPRSSSATPASAYSTLSRSGEIAQAEELEVVADVHDGGDVLAAEALDERADELRAAEAPAESDDVHALTSMALRVFGPT